MAFKGITFAGQNVTPKNDGGLYQAHYGDGILWGCSMAISGDDLVIQSGEFIAGGRVCFVDGATSVDLSGRLNNTGYIQVIMNYDLTQGEGSQWYTTFVESATTTFPALTQDDINNTDTLYQYQLAIVQVSGGNLTSVYATAGYSTLVSDSHLLLYGENRFIRITDENGTAQTIFGSIDNSYSYIGSVSGGSIVSGARFSESGTSGVILFSNGKELVFRPNGPADLTGQMFLDVDGQLHGGHPLAANSASSTLNVSANTVTSMISLQLPTTGTYMISCYADFNPSTSGTGQVNFSLGTTSSSRSIIDSRYMSGGAHIYCTMTWIASFNANDYVYFHIQAPVGGTVPSRQIRAFMFT